MTFMALSILLISLSLESRPTFLEEDTDNVPVLMLKLLQKQISLSLVVDLVHHHKTLRGGSKLGGSV